MTREEAVEYLLQMRNLYDDENGNYYVALTMAVKALKSAGIDQTMPFTRPYSM